MAFSRARPLDSTQVAAMIRVIVQQALLANRNSLQSWEFPFLWLADENGRRLFHRPSPPELRNCLKLSATAVGNSWSSIFQQRRFRS